MYGLKRLIRKYGLLSAAVVFALTMLVSCSLLKVSVSTGDPLPKEMMNTRVMTRGFYYDMASEVARAADSIAEGAPMATRIAVTRWKIRATRAGVTAAMQGIPDVALADMWILCRRMNEDFANLPDSLLFGERSAIARRVADRLDLKAEDLARDVLSGERFSLMKRFVKQQLENDPAATAENGAANTTLAWMEFLKKEGVDPGYATGTIAEVLSDVNDRISGQTQQISNSLGWTKEVIEMQLSQDSVRAEIGAQLDSLERNFDRLVIVAEHLPEISDKMMESMGEELNFFVEAIDASVNNVFLETDRQRRELQAFVTREREAMTDELKKSATEVVRNTLDAVPGVMGEVMLYVVLGILVLVGVPFGLGFWLGGVRQKYRNRKENDKK